MLFQIDYFGGVEVDFGYDREWDGLAGAAGLMALELVERAVEGALQTGLQQRQILDGFHAVRVVGGDVGGAEVGREFSEVL